MAIKPIVQKGDPVLDVVASPVHDNEFGTPEIVNLAQDMKDTLGHTDRGVAIAAPQIGVSKRIFVVKGVVFGDDEPDQVFVNPQIIKTSKDSEYMEEGCLSCGYWYGQVDRKLKASISYQDEYGVRKKRGAGGLLAHIFQHEIDHLNGILFMSKAKNLEELSEEEREKIKQERHDRDSN